MFYSFDFTIIKDILIALTLFELGKHYAPTCVEYIKNEYNKIEGYLIKQGEKKWTPLVN